MNIEKIQKQIMIIPKRDRTKEIWRMIQPRRKCWKNKQTNKTRNQENKIRNEGIKEETEKVRLKQLNIGTKKQRERNRKKWIAKTKKGINEEVVKRINTAKQKKNWTKNIKYSFIFW